MNRKTLLAFAELARCLGATEFTVNSGKHHPENRKAARGNAELAPRNREYLRNLDSQIQIHIDRLVQLRRLKDFILENPTVDFCVQQLPAKERTLKNVSK